MKVVVVGATGGVGRLLVEQGLAGGHHLVAVARRPSGFDSSVRTFSADLATAVSADLVPAFDGADVVLSALGPRNRRDAGITAIGTRIILEAMAAASIRRIVMISASPVGTFVTAAHPDRPARDPGDDLLTGWVLYPIIGRLLKDVYEDLSAAEDETIASRLDWTIVRPPQLKNGPLTKTYRTSATTNLTKGRSISRADLAHQMLTAATNPGTIHQTLRIAY